MTPATPEQPVNPATPGGGTSVSYPGPVGSGSDTSSDTSPESQAAPTLAHTGAEGVGTAAAAAGALVVGGAALYRRARAAQR